MPPSPWFNTCTVADFNNHTDSSLLPFAWIACSSGALNYMAKPLLAAATKFKVEGLVMLCENFLIDTLDVTAAPALFSFSSSIGCLRLQYSCMAVMALHLNETMHSKDFECLDSVAYRQLLTLSQVPAEEILSTLGVELESTINPSKFGTSSRGEVAHSSAVESSPGTKDPHSPIVKAGPHDDDGMGEPTHNRVVAGDGAKEGLLGDPRGTPERRSE